MMNLTQPETLFKLSNIIAVAGWLPLMIFPYHRLTERYIRSGIFPLLFALSYVVCLVIAIVQYGAFSFDTLEDINRIFSNGWGLLTGWVHYLCFDFIVATTLLLKCKKLKISRWRLIPGLFFSFMLGPVGFLIITAQILLKNRK